MREIKFRQPVYNRDGSFKEWHYWGLFKAADDWGYVSPLHRTYHVSTKITDPLDSQQFTGLLDKNGKEIYEGDILDYGDMYGKKEVSFTNGAYGVLTKTKEGTSFGSYKIHEGYIIGNIYENPELIK